ncbi:hypothetical protein J2W55_004468 [Mucilaginibacter pocheonensis]|uniref:Uncharacterized protein n=1 Tax=Mucilaginibacter pocheonensis TaxID=398050 RepID=A0ABU1TGU5_9SPHI|nr:hypothetical protein [Mucilaginibacter pocheonensis]
MTIQIQPNIHCENCIKCGKRPQIEQHKKFWIVACPNKSCHNSVKDLLVNIDAWNRLNKNNANLNPNQTLKRTA